MGTKSGVAMRELSRFSRLGWVIIMGSRPQYDLATAVTFLMAGLGIGSLLAMLFSPRDPRPALISNSASRHASP